MYKKEPNVKTFLYFSELIILKWLLTCDALYYLILILLLNHSYTLNTQGLSPADPQDQLGQESAEFWSNVTFMFPSSAQFGLNHFFLYFLSQKMEVSCGWHVMFVKTCVSGPYSAALTVCTFSRMGSAKLCLSLRCTRRRHWRCVLLIAVDISLAGSWISVTEKQSCDEWFCSRNDFQLF